MKRFLLILTIISLFGCAHVVSKEIRETVDKELTTPALFKDPDAYKGRVVILGGVIVSSTNTEEGTYIEVLQKPLDYRGRPEDTDISYGRFIIFFEGYLDTAVYSQGREMTVAGEVIGKKVCPLGEIQYPYLLIKSKELHLFKPRYGIPIRFGIGIWKAF
ncbi:MAG: Slp family lipoprotein [Thermodesulfovibrionales bacterium]|nr:Slp family lipoprotein [Thermodesulfovibrionales bacterium]